MSHPDESTAPRHLVLVGLMGAGKSTVGRHVANRLGWRFVDSDEIIEERTGRTVREIFESDGEAAFRVLETEALVEAMAAAEPSVIAAAGGVVLNGRNREALRSADARVVWLTAAPEVLADRVTSGAHRPLLDDDLDGTLRRMSTERASLYQEVADAIVSVDGRSINEVVEAVMR